MQCRVHTVDAFTDRPFRGNPAAVCELGADHEWDPQWMQAVAAEMRLSETAFVRPKPDGTFDLRWFTPAIEVDLCGHATLAAAHALWEAGTLAAERSAVFHTRSGLLTARRRGGWIDMDFPAEPATASEAPPALIEALHVRPKFIGKNRMDYLVTVDSEANLRAIEADYRLLKDVTGRGVIVTSPSDSGDFDFVSRFFAPAAGIDEDPVTGSAHCCLGPYWAAKLGKTALYAYQASPRGGVVGVEVKGDRVLLRGQAVTVVRGELL
jgi:PhzF family phenazine biosynthesis protein